jgi:hypothetical protein
MPSDPLLYIITSELIRFGSISTAEILSQDKNEQSTTIIFLLLC